MNCPKCSSKMTLLLFSAVCDTCNPPAGFVAKQPVHHSKYARAWIYASMPQISSSPPGHINVYPRLTQEQAHNHRGSLCQDGSGSFYEVFVTIEPENAGNILGAKWAVDEAHAFKWRVRGYYAAWLVNPL